MCIKKNAIDQEENSRLINTSVVNFHTFSGNTDIRTDYNELKEMPTIFELARFVAMSGTLTKDQVNTLPQKLELKSPKLISITPDRQNIFLEKKIKVNRIKNNKHL